MYPLRTVQIPHKQQFRKLHYTQTAETAVRVVAEQVPALVTEAKVVMEPYVVKYESIH